MIHLIKKVPLALGLLLTLGASFSFAEDNPSDAPPKEIPVENVKVEQGTVQSRLSVTAGLGSYRVGITDNTNGSTGTFGSNLSPGLLVQWKSDWKDTLNPVFFASGQYVDFSAPSNKTLESGRRFLTGFGLGLETRLPKVERFQGGFYFQVQQEAFIRGASTLTLTVDSPFVPQLGARAEYILISANPWGLVAEAGLGAIFSLATTNFVLRNGYEGYLRALATFYMPEEDLDLMVGLSFNRLLARTNISSNVRMNLALLAGVVWHLGR